MDVTNLGHEDGIPESLPKCGVWFFSHSYLKMCKICLKHTLDATFLDCLALTFCDVIGELLREWACLTLQGGTTFLLMSKLADIPVSRVRKRGPVSQKDYNKEPSLLGPVYGHGTPQNTSNFVQPIAHLCYHVIPVWLKYCQMPMKISKMRTNDLQLIFPKAKKHIEEISCKMYFKVLKPNIMIMNHLFAC